MILEGQDAYSNACGIDAAQVQVTCQPEAALQHIGAQAGSTDTAVSIHAKAVAQGAYQALPQLLHSFLSHSGCSCCLLQNGLVLE